MPLASPAWVATFGDLVAAGQTIDAALDAVCRPPHEQKIIKDWATQFGFDAAGASAVLLLHHRLRVESLLDFLCRLQIRKLAC
jgi:hypothetical protein